MSVFSSAAFIFWQSCHVPPVFLCAAVCASRYLRFRFSCSLFFFARALRNPATLANSIGSHHAVCHDLTEPNPILFPKWTEPPLLRRKVTRSLNSSLSEKFCFSLETFVERFSLCPSPGEKPSLDFFQGSGVSFSSLLPPRSLFRT